MKKYGVFVAVAVLSIVVGFLLGPVLFPVETSVPGVPVRTKSDPGRRERELEQKIKRMEADHAAKLQETEAKVRRARQVANENRKDYLYERAILLIKTQEFGEAARVLQEVLVLDPGDKDIYYDLAIVYDEHLDRPERAAGYYSRYLEMIPEDDPRRSKVQTWKTECLKRAAR